MSESQITEGVVVRIAHELEVLVQEMAELCVPLRRGLTELRLRRTLYFGRQTLRSEGEVVETSADFVWIDISEKPERLGRQFRMDVRDMTFEPGCIYKIWSFSTDARYDVLRITVFLSALGEKVLAKIRKDLELPGESAKEEP